MKEFINKLPPTRILSSYFWTLQNSRKASVSRSFWEKRYSDGCNSGQGSYGQLAHFKAKTIDEVREEFSVRSVIDFGCGDGYQIRGLTAVKYTGVDVSKHAVERCRSL